MWVQQLNLFSKISLGFLALLIILIAGCSILVLYIRLHSPGTATPYLDEDNKMISGSISEKGFVEINGGQLGYFIKGKDHRNPVLLYLHGGLPDYFLTGNYPTGLDDLFTVVWWEQRGAGLSYKAWNKENTITIDDLISDTADMASYLCRRFSQDKIYLMGHSGGTYLGIKVIEKHPELFRAYFGVAQIVYQKDSELRAYRFILREYGKENNKKKIVNTLLAHPVTLDDPLPKEYLKVRDKAMHDLGVGTMRSMRDVVHDIFIPSLLFPEYSLEDKVNLWRGKAASGISILWDEIITHDLAQENLHFEIPVYFFHGIYDYTCSYDLAKDYYEKISAPRKGFYTCSESAHSPIFEEPSLCVDILRKILDSGDFHGK